MNEYGRFLILVVFLLVADLPWLSAMMGPYKAIIRSIQGGSEVRMRPLAGLVVYPALAYLSLKTTSWKDAFYTGLATYAVYDFTVFAIFEKYPLWLAFADTLWGGILFSGAWFLRQRFLSL